jgi:pyruvate dehydrogenase (quinone)
MFQDVADYVHEAAVPSQVRHLVDRAMRTVLGRNGIGVLVLPNDLQDKPYEDPPRKHGSVFSGVGYSKPRVVPQEADLRRAAEVLNAGKKVAILVGAGALHATDEVIAVADRLQAGAAKALLGKAALPDDLPWVTGSIGILGTKASWDLMTHCDTLLMIGTGFPYAEFLPRKARRARCRSTSTRPCSASAIPPRSTCMATACRDPAPAAAAAGAEGRRLAPHVEGQVRDSWKLLENRALQPANPLNPQRVAWELSPQLPATPSSPATPAPAPTGSRATCACSAGRCIRCPAAWPRWARRCRMRSPPSSRTRSGP